MMSADATRPHVSIIVNGHREGAMAVATFQSLDRAVRRAHESGLRVEVIGVLDDADEPTRRAFSEQLADSCASDTCLVEVSVHDLGPARNAGVKQARGEVIGVLDADDLITANWIARAHDMVVSRSQACVVHPEVMVVFGDESGAVTQQWSSDEPRMRLHNLIDHNYWCSTTMARAEVFRDHPYGATKPESGWGTDDWAWNVATVADDVAHLLAPGTALFYRRKAEGSLAAAHVQARTLLPQSSFFTDPARAAQVAAEAREGGEEIAAESTPALLCDEVLAEWRTLQASEPALGLPTAQRLRNLRQAYPPVAGGLSVASAAWWQLVDLIGAQRPDVMVFAPGDDITDPEVTAYVDTLVKLCPDSRVVVFAADTAVSADTTQLPEQVGLINLVALAGYAKLRQFKRARLLGHLVTQYRPLSVHIVGAASGFDAVEYFSRAMAEHSQIVVAARSRSCSTNPASTDSASQLFADRGPHFLDHVSAVIDAGEDPAGSLLSALGLNRAAAGFAPGDAAPPVG